jgi:RNA polymerase sigma-70 factor, ECF subfamily
MGLAICRTTAGSRRRGKNKRRVMTDAEDSLRCEDDSTHGLPPDGGSLATSISLLERARHDDSEAWNCLVELYAPLVYHWCRTWGLKSSVAEDIGQDVFLSVAIGLSRFRKERPEDTFRGWLRVITRRRVADYLRQAEAEPHAAGDDRGLSLLDVPHAGPAEAELSWEARFLYERAVELIRTRFSERDWEAFYRTAVRGEPARSVADELSMSLNSVYLARSRIAHFVREEFAGIIDE